MTYKEYLKHQISNGVYQYTGETNKNIKNGQIVTGPAYKTHDEDEKAQTDDWFLIVSPRFGAPVVVNIELFEPVES